MRELGEKCGRDMNIWFVGRAPVGHLDAADGSKVFFLKSQIMSGQVNAMEETSDVKDYRWVTKQELKEYLPVEYFDAVKDCLAER